MLVSNLSEKISGSSVWQKCLEKILEKVGAHSYETWFRTTEFSIDEKGNANIFVPNQFFADFIEEHFAPLIKEVLREVDIKFSTLSFIAVEKEWQILEPITEEIKGVTSPSVSVVNGKKHQFHPNFTFESFVVGDSNRMAYAASKAVAEAPGKTSFNPLIIYGGTGLGKTHLLHSIGHFAKNESTAEEVLYLTSEEFSNQYIDYVINKKDSTSFYKKFMDIDLLLIDDIQFFSGKTGTQKEFFRIFNRLLLENKQIVLSSDRPPEKIPDMMDHIISRFLGGLITDIQPPNLETRIAIIRKKAEIDGVILPENVIQYVAANITSNVREIEGILIKLIAFSSFTGKDINLQVAQELCGDVKSRDEERISIKYIQQLTAEVFNISFNQLSAHSRKKESSLPRAVAMYLCKKWTKQSLRSIGLEFGGRDYTTVLYSSRRIESELKTNEELRKKVDYLESILKTIA